MKLELLLKKITPLPWTLEPFQVKTKDQDKWNELYRRHAANALPELVEAAKSALKQIEVHYPAVNNNAVADQCRCGHCRLVRALTGAEEARTEP
jgi:hypothetical protein